MSRFWEVRLQALPPTAKHSRHEQMESKSTSPKNPGSLHRRVLAERMGDREFRTEYERLRLEMLEQLAPTVESPFVNPGRKRRGRLVFGADADRLAVPPARLRPGSRLR